MKTRSRNFLEDWIYPLILGLLLCLIGCMGGGCMSGKATSQKTLAGIQYAKDAAMNTWGAYVAKEQKRADDLPDGQREAAHAKLLERRLAVDEAVTKFQTAWKLAFAAANYDNEQPAAAPVIALLTDLETSVKAYAQ
jgi:hypothetical protein